eukprot:CAMPEP_0197879676 /NCGR_PEP_ID=MMETSP1439-20131203/7707_1 /TAXON_ID=66791 /ORGANISM="Gonyaulax spinifera, Strain CCMP409" /LENGTH=61 /DNA_ID=CAMNT_0043499199 /DNA_START=322 /DNA_END=503 /DNA_ORIENTATION=-
MAGPGDSESGAKNHIGQAPSCTVRSVSAAPRRRVKTAFVPKGVLLRMMDQFGGLWWQYDLG